ncbi:MAG: HEAT repeat domain-containing protein, partial [Planctomycetota bacterium]|nr:HEAT repeat domain-containing protein [Planctomycetota bacterium]
KRILAGKGVVSGGKVSPEGARRSALNRVLDAMAKGKPGAGAWPDPFVTARVVRVYHDEDVWRICQTDPARGASRFSRATTALTEKQYLVAEVELVNNFLAAVEHPSASFQWNGSTPVKVNVGAAAVTRHRRMDYECRAKVLHALMPGSSIRIMCPVKVELSMEVRDAPARGEDLVPHLSGSGHRLDFPNRDQAWLDQRIAALKHVDVAVRNAAAEALRDTPVPEAGKALLAALQDTDEGVRRKAFEALVPLGLLETAPYAVQRLRDEQGAPDALYAIGLPAFDAIAKGLTDTDVVIRCKCAKLLADWPPKNAVDPLVKALQDPVPDVRAQAATALGELGDPRALKPLEKALEDSDTSVAHAAAMATAALTRKP